MGAGSGNSALRGLRGDFFRALGGGEGGGGGGGWVTLGGEEGGGGGGEGSVRF